jgi:hypothetical protein
VQAQLAAGIDDPILLPGKHFLQEEFPREIAAAVRGIADQSRPR